MEYNSRGATITLTIVFKDFLDYLVRMGYSDSIENLLEGVFQRAFFDEYVYYLAKRKLTSNSIVDHIKDELMP
jgi:hypothetical protein